MNIDDVKKAFDAKVAELGLTGSAKDELKEMMNSLTPENKLKMYMISFGCLIVGFVLGAIIF